MIYNEGDLYDGYWKEEKKEGKGIMKFKNGEIIDSYWKEVEDLIPAISKELKELFIRMVSYSPNKRPTIQEILDSDWMKEIKNLYENTTDWEALGLMRKTDLGTNSPKIRMMNVAITVCTSNNNASLLIHCPRGMVSNLAIAME